MDTSQIEDRIAAIEACAGDPEAAHLEEDQLLSDVLGAIATGADDPAGLAFAALKVHAVSFPRWYA